MNNINLKTALLLTVVAGATPFTCGQATDPAKPPAAKAQAHGESGHGDANDEHVDEVRLSEAAVTQNNIRVAPAETHTLAASVVAPSRVAFNTEAMAHVGSVVSGRVVEIKARVGDRVKKNDALLVVESPELGRAQSDFLRRRTEAEIATAAVGPAQDAYTRAKNLFDASGGIAFSEVQKREVDYRNAAGEAAGAKAALQAARTGLDLYGADEAEIQRLVKTGQVHPRFGIRAPIDGQVVEREVTLGELVSPDKDKLLVLADTRSLWVLADVPEARLADVGVGSRAEVRLAALPGERIHGEVSLVSSEIDATTRTARLRIVVENPTGKLRPGMFAKALVQSTTAATGQVAVPDEAVQIVEGKSSVFVPVAGEPNTFARREVSVGRPVNGFIPIRSGLRAGEPVVVTGSFILKAELGKSEAGHDH